MLVSSDRAIVLREHLKLLLKWQMADHYQDGSREFYTRIGFTADDFQRLAALEPERGINDPE